MFQLALLTHQTYLLMFILGGSPTKKVEDFILQFETAEEAKKKIRKIAVSSEEEMKTSKEIWSGPIKALAAKDEEERKLRAEIAEKVKRNLPKPVTEEFN